jgi:hypothetical protein
MVWTRTLLPWTEVEWIYVTEDKVIAVYVMKACGSVEMKLSRRYWLEMSVQLHAPAGLISENEPPTHSEHEGR